MTYKNWFFNYIHRGFFLVFTTTLLFGCDKMYAQKVNQNNKPVFPGWYADPEGVVFADEYWIFPTYSAPCDKQVFLDAFSSKDLVNWEKHKKIIDTAEVKWAERAMWAPAIIEKDDEYFLFFSANDIQSDEEIGGIGVAKASTPNGLYKDHLGEPLIGKFHNGAQPIDQFVFGDKGESIYYMFYGGWQNCNVAILNEDFTGFKTFENGETFKEVTPEGYIEGSLMFKINGKYYFMWSEGGWTGSDYSVAYAIADSPTGPFKKISKIYCNKILKLPLGPDTIRLLKPQTRTLII